MKKYAIKRILQLIPILFAITFLSYGMMRIAGSDVVTRKMENTGGGSVRSCTGCGKRRAGAG